MRFAERYRLGRALAAAAGLLIGIAWLGWARSHPPTEVEQATAEITEVLEHSLTDRDRIVGIRLEDGREGRIVVPRYAARAGAEIPLVVESYSNGDTFLTFDVEEWMDRASARR